ncbi:mechanosensitive ion channel family protein [Pontibacter burrus]|uniref:Mechanosensitive ion channel n=1 Tax=Pontibacter burrus TaxID=2704466 RepID=A0A6B3LXK2_9BACT|nr:mechanosensitive ion channel domain-containing protein [Pontibacter burrus]NEM99066.1 mechanosensitive ion channel [Pontibacter burrus]
MINDKIPVASPSAGNYTLRILLTIALLSVWLLYPARAQDTPPDTADTTQEIAAPTWPEDSLGRRTPKGTVEGFIKAVANQNYQKAAQYLNIDTTLIKTRNGPVLAQALQQLMDRTGKMMPYAWISDSPEGNINDDLGPNLDQVGTITINADRTDLVLERTQGPDGGPIWLFSSQTVQRIPLPVEEAETSALVDKVTPEVLEENKWGGVPIGHWLTIIVLAIVSYIVAKGVVSLIIYLIPLVWRKAREEATAGIIRAFALPVRLYLAVWIFVLASRYAGISIIVRLRLSEITVIVGIVAMLLLVWQLMEFLTRLFEKQLVRRNNQAGVSAVLFLRRGLKVALLILGVILALDTFGFDVTAGIAALGIGGIALALGAQKTVENFVGSVTLIADQPIRVGDYCQVGSVSGTVEQIGMRSTRIRTNERTIVTIPNGEFSSLHIENFAPRDRFLMAPKLRLRYDTTPDQVRYLLVELRTLLYAHPKVSPDPARIRFAELAQDALILEVYAYVTAKDFDEFLQVKEDLFLRMMDVIKASGTDFALPSQMLFLARDKGLSEEQAQEVSATVRQWRDSGEMQLPDFDRERINKLRNTIPFPPEGSSKHKNKS